MRLWLYLMQDIANPAYQLGKKYSNMKIVTKVLRSLPSLFDAQLAANEKVCNTSTMRLDKLTGSLQGYEVNMSQEKLEKGLTLQVEINKIMKE